MIRILHFIYKKCLVFLLLFTNFACTQSLTKVTKLDKRLKEISGLTRLNDTVLIAHNDSGDEPILYFLNLEGEIIHQLLVSNAKNVDWEDITTDNKGSIFIADIGNNGNKRKNLKIYCVESDSLLFKNQLEARVINISYEDQEEFPPSVSEMHYDAEALGFYSDSLFIFTKSHTQPFDGLAHVYKLPAKPGTYKLKVLQKIQLKSRKFSFDALTAAEFFEDKCYVLTYSGIEVFSLDKGTAGEGLFVHEKRISLRKLSQKEALTVNKGFIYIADEYNKKLGGEKLYKLKIE